jgi:hypothetical protein
MPTKTTFMSEDSLRAIPLPNHGGKYAVVPHGTIIDETRKQLNIAGFEIEKELYKTSMDGQIAQGVYHLKYGNDADMGLMFAWSNSYNKQMRFKCAVGAQVFICMNGVVSGDLANYNRKHMGASTLNDVFNSINNQITHAKEHYNLLVHDKEMLKNTILTPRLKGKILGELFANDEILTLTQVGIVKREMDKPSHNYNSDVNSAWTMYNHITFALKESHPGHFIGDHQKVHKYFVNAFGQLITPQIDGGGDYDIDKEEIKESLEAMEQSILGVNFL